MHPEEFYFLDIVPFTMGANIKRKEARKRKFEGQNCVSRPDAGGQWNEGTSPDHPPKKKSKHTLESPVLPKNIKTVEKVIAGKLAVARRSTDWGKDDSAYTATQKVQRFILFVGPSNPLMYADLGPLTVLFLPRKFTLHCNR